jgi:hypothetical protein
MPLSSTDPPLLLELLLEHIVGVLGTALDFLVLPDR